MWEIAHFDLKRQMSPSTLSNIVILLVEDHDVLDRGRERLRRIRGARTTRSSTHRAGRARPTDVLDTAIALEINGSSPWPYLHLRMKR